MRRLAAALLGAAALATASAVVAPAQPTAPPQPATTPGAELTVYLLTMGPGDAVWERFGHNALWIRDEALGTDVAYNWGLFDFEQPGFVPRFLAGTMQYWMDGFDAQATVDLYARLDRSVWAQELRLTPAQRVALRDFVEWNRRPEHRFYHYDYFLDNCSTRVRDAIDRALGGVIRAATAGVPAGSTYRSETLRLMAVDPLTFAGIDVALGQPADRPLSRWEEMFIPMRLRDHIRALRVPDGRGGTAPLVVGERELFRAGRPAEPDRMPSRTGAHLAVGVVLGAALALLGLAAGRGAPAARRALGAAGALWGVLAGLGGVVLTLAWAATHHQFWYRNENLLQLNPVSLALAAALPLLLARGPHPRGGRAARRAAYAAAALSAAGFLLQPLPGLDQHNGEVIALALPVHLGLAAAVWLVGRGRGRAASSTAP